MCSKLSMLSSNQECPSSCATTPLAVARPTVGTDTPRFCRSLPRAYVPYCHGCPLKTIGALRKIFAANGLPRQVVSDNGPQFSSSEFAMFMKMNWVKHIRCAPYHPSSNGAAERFVRTFKTAMKAGEGSTVPLSRRLASFLLTYRTTPHAITNETPSQLFMGRKIRTRSESMPSKRNKKLTMTGTLVHENFESVSR